MPVQAAVSMPPALATFTAEDFAALVAERDALAGALQVTTAERDLALERLVVRFKPRSVCFMAQIASTLWAELCKTSLAQL